MIFFFFFKDTGLGEGRFVHHNNLSKFRSMTCFGELLLSLLNKEKMNLNSPSCPVECLSSTPFIFTMYHFKMFNVIDLALNTIEVCIIVEGTIFLYNSTVCVYAVFMEWQKSTSYTFYFRSSKPTVFMHFSLQYLLKLALLCQG